MLGILSRKLYDLNNLGKHKQIFSTFELKGERIKRVRKTEGSDVDEVLLNWFQQERSDTVRVSGPHGNFCFSKF